MIENRVYNFSPGPACLPESVLIQMRDELLNYRGTGMSIMETSHRSPQFQEILDECKETIRSLMGIGDEYSVVFLQGGATMQFAMVPMNILPAGGKAGFVVTGVWAKKAFEEVARAGRGEAVALASSKSDNFNRIPRPHEYQVSEDLAYVHLTSNNTIFGTQWQGMPDTGDVPIVADMSSDMLSRPIDMKRVGIIYAGAQKNLGPSGVTLVIIRNDLLDRIPENLPLLLDYRTQVKNDSLYNTPPVGPIYMMNLTMRWLKEQGGLEAMHEINTHKGNLLYGTIDDMGDFYHGTAEKESRSLMNVTFRLNSEELEAKFIAEAKKIGLNGLKGHRSVGGIRVSMYNAMPVAGIETLVGFMKDFAGRNR